MDRPSRSRARAHFAVAQVEVGKTAAVKLSDGQLTCRIKCLDGEVYIGPTSAVKTTTGWRLKTNEELPVTSESQVWAIAKANGALVNVYWEIDAT